MIVLCIYVQNPMGRRLQAAMQEAVASLVNHA